MQIAEVYWSLKDFFQIAKCFLVYISYLSRVINLVVMGFSLEKVLGGIFLLLIYLFIFVGIFQIGLKTLYIYEKI